MHKFKVVRKFHDERNEHAVDTTKNWKAWRDWYRDNKIFTNFFPDSMTVILEWPPATHQELALVERILPKVRARGVMGDRADTISDRDLQELFLPKGGLRMWTPSFHKGAA